MYVSKPDVPVSRRRFTTAAGAAVAATIAKPTRAGEVAPEKPAATRDWSKIRGFNYQPSYGSTGMELWQKFDAKTIAVELQRGKKYFPGMNALRWWHSWDAFLRDPKGYARNFDQTLELANKVGCAVMPVLFNRWHDALLDYGGIYIDHFLPQSSWVQRPKMFDEFLAAVVGQHTDDPRILAWDLCNEPFSYGRRAPILPEIDKAEYDWLAGLYQACKKLGAKAPITIGIHQFVRPERVNPICDILSIHPYWVHNRPNASKEAFERQLDEEVAFAAKVGKPLLSTECCWGALDDKVRVELMRYTLAQLKQRKIGWLVYLLHHSLIADAHGPQFGPVGQPGNLAFIESDGSLRSGHEAFNDF